MMKKRNLLVLLLSFIVFSSFASAVGDVAYIYKKSFNIDQNVISAFQSRGLTVDLIQESTITTSNLNPYKLIFVGDERFTSPNKIPVNNKPTILANYYHAQVWGITDSEGVSQLGANHPLSVVVNNQMKQVYTQAAFGIGGAAIPYYFLDENNKAPSLQTVALTETTASGTEFGDVISYANPGAALFNGKTQNAKLCFFGIIESKYWTQNAKNLFNDCIGFIMNQCSSNLDCPAPTFTGAPFCLNGNVYQNQNAYSCQNVGGGNQCVAANNSVLIQTCQFGCANGQCLNVACHTNADCNDNNPSTQDICNNPGTPQSFCTNPPITCFTNSDCGTDGFTGSNFCSANNVARNFTTYTCLNPGTSQSSCTSSTSPQVTTQCANSCQNGQCVTFACSSNSECNDQNPLTFDECINPGTIASQCRNTPINCASNLDCGSSGFTGAEFCSGDNVVKNFQNATCLNPGTLQSSCSNTINPVTLQQCQFACFQGTCITCDSNLDCNDNNPATVDICNNPGTLQSSCSHNQITCNNDNDCGIDGFQGPAFCSAQGDSVRTFVDYTCNSPGTPQSSCSQTQQTQLIQSCSASCVNGACVACSSNSECNDNNPLTLDECINPGSAISQCRNTPINCASNLDCGTSGFTGSEYCSVNDVFKNFQNATCINPGTTNSFCNLQTTQVQINSCQFACFNGGCIACDSNLDCDDNNANTQDICNNPNTPQSFCSHTNTNQTINCNFNSDCGVNGPISSPFCTNNAISQLFISWTCNSPGTQTSFCSSAISQQTNQVCPQYCSNGQCVNITCFNNIDCNDNNANTQDICNSPGTPQSSCSNIPQNITCFQNSDCGSTSVISVNFCYAENVSQLVQSWTCNNPGTPASFCSSGISKQTVQMCPQFCSDGQCVNIECFVHADCNDNNQTTLDICNNPGTPQSFCTNNPIDIICYTNSDCGTDGYVNGEICVGNDITRLFQEFTCHAPGTPQSFCSSSISQQTQETCNFACSNGICIDNPPVCGNNILEAGEQCDDGNTNNGDGCSSTCQIETECTPGETQQCGITDVGLCEFGTKTCDSEGNWGLCVGAVNPATEICDTYDNDCDGQTDEGGVCQPTCQDQCVNGARQCVNSDAFKVCGDFNGDGCTEWSLINQCGFGKSCVNGFCN